MAPITSTKCRSEFWQKNMHDVSSASSFIGNVYQDSSYSERSTAKQSQSVSTRHLPDIVVVRVAQKRKSQSRNCRGEKGIWIASVGYGLDFVKQLMHNGYIKFGPRIQPIWQHQQTKRKQKSNAGPMLSSHATATPMIYRNVWPTYDTLEENLHSIEQMGPQNVVWIES